MGGSSEGNVEFVRRSFDAWNANDWEALGRFYDPDVQGKAPEGWPETGVIHGWEAVRTQFARNKDSWEEEHVEIEEIRELPSGLVLARIRWITTGKGSGLNFESLVNILFELRDGLITRVEYYFDQEDALSRVAELAREEPLR